MALLTLHESAGPLRNSRPFLAAYLAPILLASTAFAQSSPESPYYARANSFGVLTAHSNDSSHILMGTVENRKLLNIGVSYSRKLFLDRIVNWQYSGELLPVALESDPVMNEVTNYTSPIVLTTYGSTVPNLACKPKSGSYSTTSNGVTTSFTY